MSNMVDEKVFDEENHLINVDLFREGSSVRGSFARMYNVHCTS